MTTDEFAEWCQRCGKAWQVHSTYCPKSPIPQEHKWSECVCFVHPCHDRHVLDTR